jgi:hypothetical protein
MCDRLEISVLLLGSRFPAQVRLCVNGEDVIHDAVGAGGRGPLAVHALPSGGASPLRASVEARRVEVGEPECTGGCCGFLSVVVQRIDGVVQWSGWEVPSTGTRPVEFHFDADQYDAELARAQADRSWERSVLAPGLSD